MELLVVYNSEVVKCCPYSEHQGVVGQGQRLTVQTVLLATWPGYLVGLAQLEMKPRLVGRGLSFPCWLDRTCVLQSPFLRSPQTYSHGSGVGHCFYSGALKSGSGFIPNQRQYGTSAEIWRLHGRFDEV